jgi:hypothetical protein
MANYRRTNYRTTKGLGRNAVLDLSDAWHHAQRIRRPLNVMVTLRPLRVDGIAPEDRPAIWNKLLNKLGVYARQYRFSFNWMWSSCPSYQRSLLPKVGL